MNIIIPLSEGPYGVHDDPSWPLDYIFNPFQINGIFNEAKYNKVRLKKTRNNWLLADTCILVVTCWESADLLALLFVMVYCVCKQPIIACYFESDFIVCSFIENSIDPHLN